MHLLPQLLHTQLVFVLSSDLCASSEVLQQQLAEMHREAAALQNMDTAGVCVNCKGVLRLSSAGAS
jgi:hypothetical protein